MVEFIKNKLILTLQNYPQIGDIKIEQYKYNSSAGLLLSINNKNYSTFIRKNLYLESS